jgi:UTP--glucose-1-phosphate uridylyltransferase
VQPGHGNEIQLTDALKQLESSIGLITCCKRYDIGDKLGWMKSSIEMTLAREEFADELKCFLKDLLKI